MNFPENLLANLAKLNAIILVALVIPIATAFLWGIADGGGLIPAQELQLAAFIGALVFGLLALKWNKLFYVSLLLWGVFFLGFQQEQTTIKSSQVEACLQKRQNPHCTEEKDGTMDCQSYTDASGKYHSGSLAPYQCAGVGK